MFPEYADALRLQREGNFRKATPLLQRMLDVVVATMGDSSAPAVFLRRRTAALHVKQGLFSEALKLLGGQGGEAQDPGSRTAAAMVLLLSGDTPAAVSGAMRAVELCEQAGVVEAAGAHEQDGFLLLSSSYGALGVSSAYCALDARAGPEAREQSWYDAEAFLQMAARWSQQQTQTQHQSPSDPAAALATHAAYAASNVSTLANLGSLCIFKLADAGQADEQGVEQGSQMPLSLPLLRFEAVQAPGREQGGLLQLQLVREALGYWEEALQAAVGGGGSSSSAAAMCGVAGMTPDMTMTGMSSVEVKKASSDLSPAPPSPTLSPSLEQLLTQVRFLEAYCGVLCNFAELYELSGNLGKKQEYVSAALAAVQVYTDRLSSDSSSSSGSSSGSSGSGTMEHHPVLGRVLTLAAVTEMQAGRAVAAEGLFRSALGYLESPHALLDPRCQLEGAVALAAYGALLGASDKRKEGGREMQQQARQKLVKLLKEHSGAVATDRLMPLTALMQLPQLDSEF